ncbi:glycoside hydrolase family 172 protein [Aeoliella sp. SH292]|uniref:glycoside hydrolase family 172 protein n=1 Tax=Aeoliella sp. SH292 TaxID=3454464 RepID=UPI003F9498C1
MRACVRSFLLMMGTLVLGGSMSVAADVVTLPSLLEEMTSRETLARFPQPAYTCAQASSYDRDSVDPADHDKWMANGDRSQWVRIDDVEIDGKKQKEYVMMDQEGPGALVRFWATWHGPRVDGKVQKFSNGTLRVYLDGSDKPAIEGPIEEVISKGLLCEGPLSQSVSPLTPYANRGHNLYFPIPYAKSCKVTYTTDVPIDRGARTGEALYYQINYRTYEPGTQVETFSMDNLAKAEEAVAKAQEKLLGYAVVEGNSRSVTNYMGQLAAGDSATLEMEGSQAIRQISLKLDAENQNQALRSTILKIEFDGEQTVWVPVGEFFGIGYQPAEHKTFYTETKADGSLAVNWVMPFAKSAKLTLENLGDQTVNIADWSVTATPWKWDDRSLHFHTTWHELRHVDTWVDAKKPGAGAYDVNYVTVNGKGVYAGDTLTIFNGAARWWGEGDEKIYVDGEKFPSHFGTGTEDYYGYAWCRPENFTAPMHAQPTGDGNLVGGFAVNSRYRALDAIPFEKSLKFDMELWHWADTKVNFAPTTFFYARPGATTNSRPLPDAATQPVTMTRGEIGTVFAVEGAIEAETLKVASVSGGNAAPQVHGDWGWSNDSQVWWQGAKEGDELVIEFPVKKAGRYAVDAALTSAPDYAKVDILVNDQKAASVDGYAEDVKSSVTKLGEFDLAEGTNRLTVRMTGYNPKAQKRGMFGLDYLKLEAK